jgi:ApbE superfamily uncharacterized protein (UPF0280 family)
MGAQAHILPCGTRLHLQHGPIDLIIGADGDRTAAFHAARNRFETVLQELMKEISDLRRPLIRDSSPPKGQIAKRMDAAARPFAQDRFVTCMAAVAGGVADTILTAMTAHAELSRAYVNNGGDIAIHLGAGQHFTTAMTGHDGSALGRVTIKDTDSVRGIATSGRHGRSHSLGIADSVTVLAKSAAAADVAATLIANAVDLPNHPNVTRMPACDIDETSDLGDRLVVTNCERLAQDDQNSALAAGLKTAENFRTKHLICGAALFLQGANVATRTSQLFRLQRTPEHA